MSRRQRKRDEKQRRHGPAERFDPRRRQLAVGTGATIGATLAMGGVAHAACTCTVDSLADPTDTGHTTLRDALLSAETSANSNSTITFASGLSGAITLGSTLPTITYPTTIAGPGAGQIAVSGNDLHRVFRIDAGGAAVTISGLTITHGHVTGSGAGIFSNDTDLTVANSVISTNTVLGSGAGGGGIYASGGGTLSIVGSTITGNTAAANGGGVYTAEPSGPAATIRSSTISGNHAATYGGGAYFNYAKPATVENSTIYGNTADHPGGGLYHYGQPAAGPGLTVTGSTITHNTAPRGGGVASYGNPAFGQPTLRDTIVAGNNATTGPDLSAQSGSMHAAFSLIGSVAPATTLNQSGPNILGQDPQLGPLASNGGPTQTQKPAASSPVIDKGLAFGLTTDQRGNGRPFEIPSIPNVAGGDGSDIGAVELQASELPSNTFTLGHLQGKTLPVNVSVAGSVSVSDAGAPLAADASKKKRKLLLNASSATGGAPSISVPLRLTKLAKQKLRQKGKVSVKARVSFTPKYGIARTVTAKLKIKSKKR